MGNAVKTKLQRVHCTEAPEGGSSRGSRSYCIEHWGQAICTARAYHTEAVDGA